MPCGVKLAAILTDEWDDKRTLGPMRVDEHLAAACRADWPPLPQAVKRVHLQNQGRQIDWTADLASGAVQPRLATILDLMGEHVADVLAPTGDHTGINVHGWFMV